MAAPSILRDSALENSAEIAATLMDEIQDLVNAFWVIDYEIPGGGGTLTGSPNNLNYDYTQTYEDSGTIVPGVPAYTITPAYTVPAVVSPAVPGWGTTNICGPWSSCTTEVPGTPAYTVTPAYVVPAVVSPAIPALTGGYSTELDISATVQGISDALNPLFSSVTFTSGEMTGPNSQGLATETVTYNLDQIISGNAIRITGRAAFDDLSVDVAGVTTNFGNVSTGTLSLDPIPNVPIYFDAIIEIPSYSSTPDRTANGVAYELFPLASSVSTDNVYISSGVTAVADFINDDLLSYLTDFWNYSVVPLYTAVGATAPEAPSQTLANIITDSAEEVQADINAAGEAALNSLLKSQLSTIQPYVQALTAATWDYSDYPIVPNGDYTGALLAEGMFSGVDASNSSFDGANLNAADFSNANLTGSTFTNANLTGANFAGATGAPQNSLSLEMDSVSKRKMPFKDSVIFGANFKRSSLNVSGAFYDDYTKFAKGFKPSENNLIKFNAARFVAGNSQLIKEFGSDIHGAAGAFAANLPPYGQAGEEGLRSDVITGKLLVDGFKPRKFLDSLSDDRQQKLLDFTSGMKSSQAKDTIAMYKIAKEQDWTTATSEMYLTSNSDLIKPLGGPSKAVDKARNQYLNKGFFQKRPLNEPGVYDYYVETYPDVLFQTGAVFDEASLAHHYVNVGYAAGQQLPYPVQ